MSLSQIPEFLQKVEKLSQACGIEGEHDLENFQFGVCFGLADGRTQEVFVADSSSEPEVQVITVFSTCLVVEKGMFSGVSKKMAVELLKLNETLNFARYGIQEDEESFIIVASYDLILDGLDPNGFEAALECVALAADSYEARFGQDIF